VKKIKTSNLLLKEIIRFIFRASIILFFIIIPSGFERICFAAPPSPFESNPMPCPSAYVRNISPTSEVMIIPLFAPKKDACRHGHFWLIPIPPGAEFKIIADESAFFIDSLHEIKKIAATWFYSIKYSNDIFFAYRLLTEGFELPFYRQIYEKRASKLPQNYFDKIFKYEKINGGWPEIKTHALEFGGIDEKYKPVVDYYYANECRFVFIYIADQEEFDRKAAYNPCKAVKFNYRGLDYKTNMHALVSYPSSPDKLFYPFKMLHECKNGDYPLMITVLNIAELVIDEKLDGHVDLKYITVHELEQELKNGHWPGYSYFYDDFCVHNSEKYKIYSRITVDSTGLDITNDSMLHLDLKNAGKKSNEIRNFVDTYPINGLTLKFILIMTMIAAAFGYFGGKYFIGRNWRWFAIVTAGQWFVYAASNYTGHGDPFNWIFVILFISLPLARSLINNVFWYFLLLVSPPGAVSEKLKIKSSISGYFDIFIIATSVNCFLICSQYVFTLTFFSNYGRFIAFTGTLIFLMNVKKFYPFNLDDVADKYKLNLVSVLLIIPCMAFIAYVICNTNGTFSSAILLIISYLTFFMLHLLFEHFNFKTLFIPTYWVKGLTLNLITIGAFGFLVAFIAYSFNDYVIKLPLIERIDEIKALSLYGASYIPNVIPIARKEPDEKIKNILLNHLIDNYRSEIGSFITPYLQAAFCAIIIFLMFKYDRKIFVYYLVYCISFFILLFYANMYVDEFLHEKFYKTSIIVKHGGIPH